MTKSINNDHPRFIDSITTCMIYGNSFLITAENQEKYLIFEKKLILYAKIYSNW